MGLNDTPSSERIHIAFFGVRNAGKSSLVNRLTGQEMSLVSSVKGTTTDPVTKSMELSKAGPVLIIDTPGIDDSGELGEKRAEKTRRVLGRADIAVLVTECGRSMNPAETELADLIRDRNIPSITVRTKADLYEEDPEGDPDSIRVSSKTGMNMEKLKEALTGLALKNEGNEKHLVSDLLKSGDEVILVVPIDESAPKGRLILPQQQTIRDILEAGCSAVVCRDTELKAVLEKTKAPRMVITDSQVYGKVSKIVPEEIPLTSFSILFARYKGELEILRKGAERLSSLKDGDRVLIAEGCTHHRQCNDIGSVKIPGWIREYSGAEPEFDFCSGGSFPEELSSYSLIIHCGGCMLNGAEMRYRIEKASEASVPIVNYGMAIAQMNGILERCMMALG